MEEDKNMIMIDYSHLDPRSFKRHLAGTGDQRVEILKQFDVQNKRTKFVDMEEYETAFSARAYDLLMRAKENGRKHASLKSSEQRVGVSIGKILVALFEAATGFALALMVYEVFLK